MLNIKRNQCALHPCKLITVFQNQSMTPHHSEILVRKYWTRRFIWRHLLAKPSTWRHPSPSWCPSVGAWVTSDRDRCLPGETPDTQHVTRQTLPDSQVRFRIPTLARPILHVGALSWQIWQIGEANPNSNLRRMAEKGKKALLRKQRRATLDYLQWHGKHCMDYREQFGLWC